MGKLGISKVFLFILLLLVPSILFGTDQVKIIVDGKQLILSQPVVMEEGTTLVPLRDVFNTFNVSPKWNSATKEITATKNGVTLWLQINNKVAKIGDKTMELNVPAKIYNGTTMVPIRFISESFGVTPKWNNTTNTITINTTGGVVIDKNNIEDYFKLTYKDVIKEYGEPLYSDFYNGAYRIYYENLDYLFSGVYEDYSDQKVSGIIAGPKTTIYNVKLGMSLQEVKNILGTPLADEKDESGEGYEWFIYYRIDDYDLWLNSNGPKQPLEMICVVKTK